MDNVKHHVQKEILVDSMLNVKPSDTKSNVLALHLLPETEKWNVSVFQTLASQIRAVHNK